MLKINYDETPNWYELDEPAFLIVLHATTSPAKQAIDWLKTTPEDRLRLYGTKTYSSANAVFSRLGDITELAGPDRGTWHAGKISNPSERAKKVLRKDFLGRFKNPNKYSIGLEVAAHWDIDKDGILEGWEKLYSPQAVKSVASYILHLEKKLGRQFPNHHILTHKDITSYKPDIEIARAMVLTEIMKQRVAAATELSPAPIEPVIEPEVDKEATKNEIIKLVKTL